MCLLKQNDYYFSCIFIYLLLYILKLYEEYLSLNIYFIRNKFYIQKIRDDKSV